MRLTRHGAAIISVFLVGGLVMLAWGIGIADGESTFAGVVLIVMGAMWLGGALIAVGVAVAAELRGRRREGLARTGIKGTATIVEIIGPALPPLEAVLELDIPGSGTRRVKRSLMMEPYIARNMKPGMVLPVYANPSDPDDLLFVV
jgi:hypothetical protein